MQVPTLANYLLTYLLLHSALPDRYLPYLLYLLRCSLLSPQVPSRYLPRVPVTDFLPT